MAKKLNIDLKNVDLKQVLGSLKGIDLTTVKKYSSLFPSIGLFLLSLAFLAGAMLVVGSVNKKMEGSIRMATDLRTKAGLVPSEAQVTEEEKYYQQYKQDADSVIAMSAKASQRELICYNPVIFPVPADKSAQVYNEFGKQYRSAIVKLLDKISAKDAPSEAEIRSLTGVGVTAPALGGWNTPSATSGSNNARVDALCLKRAEETPVYATPTLFSWYGYWDTFTYKSVDDSLQSCWNSQVAFWIYEDVVSTIEAVNRGSSKVTDSAVKRLLGIRFDGPVIVSTQGQENRLGFGMGGFAASNQQTQDAPTYVKSESPFMSIPWTGRKCNDVIDVIHFAVSVISDSESVAMFMKELSSGKNHTYLDGFKPGGKQENAIHNQITILQYEIEPVSKDNAVHSSYRYGKSGVVQLNLVCEYIFNRQGYDVIKPAPVKKLLGQEDPSQQAAATSPQ